LIERGIVKTVKSAKKIVDKKEPVVWDILENVLVGHPVLLNRAPTLHRLGIQAFQPKLVEGKAIQLHPLVCTGFNADFDGDQMAVHVPLSNEACLEAMVLMLASHNILHPANGKPITLPSQDMVLGIYYLTKGRPKQIGEGLVFSSFEEVVIAHNEGRLAKHAHIRIRVPKKEFATGQVHMHPITGKPETEIIETTCGRVMFNQIVPVNVPYINKVLTKKAVNAIISDIFTRCGLKRTAIFLDDLKALGFRNAFAGGLSFGLSEVLIPEEKEAFIKGAETAIAAITDDYEMGFITENERYNQVIDEWTKTNRELTKTLMLQLENDNDGFNSVYMMLDSGARGSREQIRQLGGMRGLMAKPQKSLKGSAGEIIENPILSNFKEGLSVLEYFISTHGARKGLADTALKTADAGYLTRRLVDVSQDVIITESDCGTLRGLKVEALIQSDELVEGIGERALGRVAVEEIRHPETDEVIVPANEMITETYATALDASGLESIEIRSVLTCESKNGVCIKCYGRNLATGRHVEVGEAVGVIAAQSIGEPGTQLTLRTFHVGGAANRLAADSKIVVKYKGRVEFENIRTVQRREGDDFKTIVITRSGEMRLMGEKGRVLSTHNIPYGSQLLHVDGAEVEKGTEVCRWDPYNAVILSEFDGVVLYDSLSKDMTFLEETEETTGHTEKVVIDSRDRTLNPAIKVCDAKGKPLRSYSLPIGSHIMVDDKEEIKAGQILVKIPRVSGKTSDITGGLPRVTELFEARNPSNPAAVSEIDGIVSLGGIKRGNREVFVTSRDGSDTRKYMIPLTKHILVQDNDLVYAGDLLSDGAVVPAEILAIKGPSAVQAYIVNEIQEVYRLQGVKINDKHIEVVVRQMMQKLLIVDAGDTIFLEKEQVSRRDFQEENDWIWDKVFIEESGDSEKLKAGQIVSSRKLREENQMLARKELKLVVARVARPAVGRPILQGITRASLGTKSWLSAASFQETTKVLSEAAITAKTDELLGLKENVIVGHLIPAGTGLREYEDVIVGDLAEFKAKHANEKAAETRHRDVVRD
ncbi:MAG: DNA-directed polymerase subunit beta, partial [Bacteroidota bacterium]